LDVPFAYFRDLHPNDPAVFRKIAARRRAHACHLHRDGPLKPLAPWLRAKPNSFLWPACGIGASRLLRHSTAQTWDRKIAPRAFRPAPERLRKRRPDPYG